MSYPPGINTSDLLRLGNNPDSAGVALGKDEVFVVDNTTTPATVRLNGGQTVAGNYEELYIGTMSGPWLTPVPFTAFLTRTGSTSHLKVLQSQYATTDVADIDMITLSPPIPPVFRPPSTAAGAGFLYFNPSFFGAPFFSTLLVVDTAGTITLHSFSGPWPLGIDVGLATSESLGWPSLLPIV